MAHGNVRKGAGHCTVEDLRRDEEELNWRDHHGPPYSWGEIEAQLGRGEPDGVEEQPEQRPKCLECLQPMEWMYYKDEPESWISSGWTAICRGCHTWRACRIPGFPGLTGWESVAAEALATGTHGMG